MWEQPRVRSALTTAVPTKPLAPVTRVRRLCQKVNWTSEVLVCGVSRLAYFRHLGKVKRLGEPTSAWLSSTRFVERFSMSATSEPASNSAFEVRFYRPGDEEGMLRVLQASFPRWPDVETDVPPIDHLRWKIENAPEPAATHIIAEADGRVIGCRISLLQRVRHGSTFGLARTDIDNAVAPDWRGKGVNAAITSFIVDVSKADIVMTSTLVETIRRVDASLGHRRLRNRLAYMHCDLTAAPPRPDTTVKQLERFDERFDRFIARAAAPFDLIATPDVTRLNWRYCDPAGGKGTVFYTELDGEITGFIAIRISRGEGVIAYLLVLPDRHDLVRTLTLAGLARLHAAGIQDIRCALPEHHPYRAVLKDAGFSRNGNRVPFTARPRVGEPELTFLEKESPIHWMLGDTDLI